MKILAIETSCDETAIAIAQTESKEKNKNWSDFKIISESIASQIKIHKKWGGVYPSLAKREHQKNLVPTLVNALKKANLLKKKGVKKNLKESWIIEEIFQKEPYLGKKTNFFLKKYKKPDIDLIAVTIGPGLEPCLWAGINFARALSFFWKIPIIAINHIEAHIFANWLAQEYSESKNENQKLIPENILPAMCLVVSGGHTQLILIKKMGKYKIVGETLDDAAGEAFDKIARILGLGYPGGVAIAKQSQERKLTDINQKYKIKLPRPMINSKNFDFSFSGLKTAVLYDYKSRDKKIKKKKDYIREMAYHAQKAIIDVLTEKTIKAAQLFNCKSIILGGGVAANEELKKEFVKKINNRSFKNLKFIAPTKKLSTDNAQMIAACAYFYLKNNVKIKKEIFKDWKKIEAQANLRIE